MHCRPSRRSSCSAPPCPPSRRGSSATIRSRASRIPRMPPARSRRMSGSRTTCPTTSSSRRAHAVEQAGAQHQHRRRGARLELVHQSHRQSRRCRSTKSCADPTPGRRQRRRSGSSSGRSRRDLRPGSPRSDANGETWFVSFDPPSNPKGATGAVVIATKLFWALGYNQVETFLTKIDPRHVEIDPKATVRRPNGDADPLHAERSRRGARARRPEHRRHV